MSQLKIDQESLARLKKQNAMMADIILDKSRLIDQRDKTIEYLKRDLRQAHSELMEFKKDPEFMAILDYQRKKRKQ